MDNVNKEYGAIEEILTMIVTFFSLHDAYFYISVIYFTYDRLVSIKKK